MNRFEDTKVLLTGAGSGIGRATALRLVAEGAAVFAVDLSGEGLARTAAEAAGPGRIATRVADVADEDAVVAAVRAAADESGGIDVLVNVAGVHRTTPIDRLTVDDLHQLFSVNAVGTALFCREALPLLPDGTGVIVNVASSAASHGNPYMTAYAASKGAVLGFSLSLAAEVAHRGIRVVPVSPGSVATPLVGPHVLPPDLDASYYRRIHAPFGTARPEQIAGVIAFAASHDAGHLTGAELRVDGGSHI
ncbi:MULTISPECIES: SDR family NAD(P)-dependent oxidoreductase [Streptomyces]|uniref:Oxidoreductase n=4 Tax=Streptomyces TaxID=1883 RepID=A0A8H9HNP0_9ACTN|nr:MULTISPECIES: SDR family oxidoreductase [Streptomyces]NEE48780.1 SDR family oxidoreductase [Streptomyces sp. SID8455]MBL3808236.1 SDR family oxidoreductase [Streptomyces sp. BRB081]QNE79813.1 SDR family oxidoreductase [Streptomyces rutgersensis]WPR49840.1 SDR family oxidoreductase [Streptomyces sp. S399]WSU39239.1 SDR family oxidoreductase [Streptomyces gougerotii]